MEDIEQISKEYQKLKKKLQSRNMHEMWDTINKTDFQIVGIDEGKESHQLNRPDLQQDHRIKLPQMKGRHTYTDVRTRNARQTRP